jgi:hypothetical protein
VTDRIPLDHLTSDQYDQLCNQLEALRAVARGYCPHCGRGDAAPTVDDWQRERRRADEAEVALARVQALAERWRYTADRKHGALPELRATLDQPASVTPIVDRPFRTHRQEQQQ